MVNVLDEFLLKWLNPPLSYILMVVIIIIAFYIIFRKVYTPQEEKFKGETIEHVIKELNLKKSFIFSRPCKKGKLYYNMGMVKISRVLETTVKHKDTFSKNMMKTKFLIFKTGNFLDNIPLISKFVETQYFRIDNDSSYIKQDAYRDTWHIQPTAFLHKMADVWICSKSGTGFVTELIYKRIYENAREEDMNYIKRVVFYNDRTASKITVDSLQAELQQEGYNKHISSETGVKPNKK